MSSGDAELAVYYTVYFINVFVFVPISCYYCYQLWKLHEAPILSVRYPHLVVVLVALYCIYTILFRPLSDMMTLTANEHKHSGSSLYFRLFLLNISHIWYALVFYRIWLLWFDYHRRLQLMNQQWQSKILDTADAAATNPTNSNLGFSPHKYLSHKVAKKAVWLCLLWFFFVEICILCSAAGQTGKHAQKYIQIVVRVIYVSLCIVLAFKVRTCMDKCFFLAEAKLVGVCGAVFVVFLIVFTVLDLSDPDKHSHRDHIVVMTFIVFVLSTFAMILIMTKWVLVQYHKLETEKSSEEPLLSASNVEFVEMLKYEDVFDLFAIHLVKELSIENLLFLFEATQFKLECVENKLIDKDAVGNIVDFGKKIKAVARANAQVTDMQSFCYNFQYILDRYISDDGEYSVNIRGDCRRKLLRFRDRALSEKDWEKATKYVGYLNEAIQSIVTLMKLDSFFRFTQTAEFKRLDL